MLDLLNNLILDNIDNFTVLISALIFILVGTPAISLKGGVPRVFGLFIKKPLSLLVLGIVGLLILFVFYPLVESFINSFINTSPEFAIPIVIFLSGIALIEFHFKMRWNYIVYGAPLSIIGAILIFLELIF